MVALDFLKFEKPLHSLGGHGGARHVHPSPAHTAGDASFFVVVTHLQPAFVYCLEVISSTFRVMSSNRTYSGATSGGASSKSSTR